LRAASGPFADLFHAIARSSWLPVIGLVIASSLVLVGLSLMLGLFTQAGSVGALVLLALFYLSNIPTRGAPMAGAEGAYLFVDKNLVEAAAVAVFLVFHTGRIAGLDLLQAAVQGESGWIRALVGTFGAWPTFLLFMLLPCALLAWPASRVGGMLAAAYRRHWLSELTLLFGVLSALALLQRALLGFVASNGLSLALLVPLVLVVPGMRLGRRVPAVRPPALLVLRVFQRDRAVSALFDRVIERWRLTGNTMLIAGTDLLERTIDAEDIYGFLGRRLRDRFVLQPGELDARLAAFDLERDLDGRHRINEVYCHDSTWRQALDALVARADVVLMDLRSFQRRNVGCRHELGVLARAAHLGRVVVLVDEHTDLADAKAAAAGASPGRFEWVDITHAGRGLARQVLARLFVAG